MKSYKKILVSFAALSALAGASFAGVSVYKRTYREGVLLHRYAIHAPMKSPYEARKYVGWLTRNGFDVAGMNWKTQMVEVVTTDAGIAFLEKNGIHGQILRTHGNAVEDQTAFDQRYLNPDKVEQQLKALNAQYPKLTRLEQIGKSGEGRPIWALLVSTTPNLQDKAYYEKPSIIFDGLHHAREIMTPEIVMDVAASTLAAYASKNQQAVKIVNGWNIWLVPMLNVDGSNIVWTKDNWWRKNAKAQGSSVYGVDLNRNYPYKWNACNGSSGTTTSDVYRGPTAASEPETQALMHLGQIVQPTASVSYHSYSELVLYPYGCNGDVTGEAALEDKIGKEMAAMLPSDDGAGNYTPGTPWQILYAVDGDSMGYMHAEFGALAYTFEVNQDFQPSYDLRQPTVEKHRKVWSYLLTRMDKNMMTIKVVDGKTGQPTQAVLDISTVPHVKGEKPFHTNAAGNFFKVLDPGSYAIQATLADGRKTSQTVVMAGQPQAVVFTVP